MATYYVAKTGNDTNIGTLASPFLTIAKGISVLAAGDTLFIRVGVYSESIVLSNIPSGSSFASATKIYAYLGETVSVIKVHSGNSGTRYIIFDSLIIDNGGTADENVYLGNNVNHLRFTNCEIRNSRRQGVLFPHPGSDYNEFINCNVHHNGTTVNLDHGFYCAARNNLIEGCLIHDNAAFGVTIYNGYGERADNNIIRKNKIYDNSQLGSGSGIGVASGSGTLVYNNIVYGHATYGIDVSFGSPANTGIYNNTVYDNNGGIRVGSDSSNAKVKNNIVYSSGGVTNNGSGTVLANNPTTNPNFVNAGAGNFQLQAGSPAIDAGVVLTEVTTDYDGVTRPQGSAWDIGAYEFVGGGTPDTTPPTGLVISPSNGSTVTGTVTITCSASDNIGVANVQFYLDGSPLGGLIT